MSIAKESGRISWLMAALGAQKSKVMSLLSRLGDMGSREGMKPTVFAKFLNMLGQVANAREEEVLIISEIEAIERKHRFQRNQGKLKRVEPESQQQVNFEPECEDDCERPGYGWEWLLAMKNAISMSALSSSPSTTPSTNEELLAYEAMLAQQQQSNSAFWWTMFALYLMTRRGISQNKQDLTAD